MADRAASRRTVLKGAAAVSVAAVGGVTPASGAYADRRARPGWTSRPLGFCGGADAYLGTRTFVDVGPSGRSVLFYSRGPRRNQSFGLWLARGPYDDGGFRHDQVEAGDRRTSGMSAMALAPGGRSHVSYVSGIYADQGVLRHAVSGPRGWTVEAPGGIEPAGATAIALGADGQPVIAYSRVPFGLFLARRTGAGWTHETVAEESRVLVHALALDADGHPRIAYVTTPTRDYYDFEVRLATFDGSGWTVETVHYVNRDGIEMAVELLIDDDGREHVVYPTWSPRKGLAYSRRRGSGWRHDMVEDGDMWMPSLARDGDGGLHVAYYDAQRGALKHASLVGYDWLSQTVADSASPSVRIGRNNGLVIDSDGRARVSYYIGREFSGSTLHLAVSDAPVTGGRLPARDAGPRSRGSAWTRRPPVR